MNVPVTAEQFAALAKVKPIKAKRAVIDSDKDGDEAAISVDGHENSSDSVIDSDKDGDEAAISVDGHENSSDSDHSAAISGRRRLHNVCPIHGAGPDGPCTKFSSLDPKGKGPVQNVYRQFLAAASEFVKPITLLTLILIGGATFYVFVPNLVKFKPAVNNASQSNVSYGYYTDADGTRIYGRINPDGTPYGNGNGNANSDPGTHNCNFDSNNDGNSDSYIDTATYRITTNCKLATTAK